MGEGMKILLTGATGYIGTHLVAKLCEKNEVYIVVRANSDTENITRKVAGIIVYGQDNIYERLGEIKPDILIHLAGVFYGEHQADNIQNLLESNIVFATVVIDAAVCAGCKKIINTGSYWQYYGKEDYNPVNLYAATKQAVEDILQYYIKAKKCKAISLQIFDSYGPNDSRNKILNIIARMKDGEEIDMSSGEQKMYYCYIDDLTDGYIRAIDVLDDLQEGEHKCYVLREKEPVRLRDIIELYLKIHQKKLEINWGKREGRDREIMDPTGMGKVLPGWAPKYTLKEGLRKI